MDPPGLASGMEATLLAIQCENTHHRGLPDASNPPPLVPWQNRSQALPLAHTHESRGLPESRLRIVSRLHHPAGAQQQLFRAEAELPGHHDRPGVEGCLHTDTGAWVSLPPRLGGVAEPPPAALRDWHRPLAVVPLGGVWWAAWFSQPPSPSSPTGSQGGGPPLSPSLVPPDLSGPKAEAAGEAHRSVSVCSLGRCGETRVLLISHWTVDSPASVLA